MTDTPTDDQVPSKPVADVTGEDVVQLAVHGALFPRLAAWLESQGFRVSPFPHHPDDLDTYMVTPVGASGIVVDPGRVAQIAVLDNGGQVEVWLREGMPGAEFAAMLRKIADEFERGEIRRLE